MNSPEVSVIIPVYNRPVLLEQALFSVQEQTFSDYEVIVADDGSDAPLLAGNIALEIPFRHLKLPHCGRPGAVRNAAVQEARGRYIAFLDSDDSWQPEKLALQLDAIKASDCRWSHTRETWLRGDTIVSQRKQRHKREGDIFEDALVKCIVGPSTLLMERSLFIETDGFDSDLEVAEDYEYWLRVLDNNPIQYVDRELTIKQAGDWDQLSAKYGQIEIFRLLGLVNLLINRSLSDSRMELASESFVKKLAIFINGAKKRNRMEIAAPLDSILSKLESVSINQQLPVELLHAVQERFLHIVKGLEDSL